jgi:hypothetical protein
VISSGQDRKMHTLKEPGLFRQDALIGGQWTPAASGNNIDVIDPATQSVVGTVPDMGTAETRAAIEAASAAYGPWKKKTHAERAALLEAWHALMLQHIENLALILTTEQGKPLDEARGEIRYGASFVKWFAEEARRIEGHTIPSPTPDRRIVVLKEPVGVCGIITPWNFPNAMITRKVAPPCRRLHRGHQAFRIHALFGACNRLACGEGRHSGRRDQHRHRHARRDRQRDHGKRDGAENLLHRFDAGRFAADARCGRQRQAAFP